MKCFLVSFNSQFWFLAHFVIQQPIGSLSHHRKRFPAKKGHITCPPPNTTQTKIDRETQIFPRDIKIESEYWTHIHSRPETRLNKCKVCAISPRCVKMVTACCAAPRQTKKSCTLVAKKAELRHK